MNRLAVLVDPTAITTVLDTLTARVAVAETELRKAHARRQSYADHGGTSLRVIERYRQERRMARAVLDEARFALRAVMDALGLA